MPPKPIAAAIMLRRMEGRRIAESLYRGRDDSQGFVRNTLQQRQRRGGMVARRRPVAMFVSSMRIVVGVIHEFPEAAQSASRGMAYREERPGRNRHGRDGAEGR